MKATEHGVAAQERQATIDTRPDGVDDVHCRNGGRDLGRVDKGRGPVRAIPLHGRALHESRAGHDQVERQMAGDDVPPAGVGLTTVT